MATDSHDGDEEFRLPPRPIGNEPDFQGLKRSIPMRPRRRQLIDGSSLLTLPFIGLVACFPRPNHVDVHGPSLFGDAFSLALVPGVMRLVADLRLAHASEVGTGTILRAHRRALLVVIAALAVLGICSTLLLTTTK